MDDCSGRLYRAVHRTVASSTRDSDSGRRQVVSIVKQDACSRTQNSCLVYQDGCIETQDDYTGPHDVSIIVVQDGVRRRTHVTCDPCPPYGEASFSLKVLG